MQVGRVLQLIALALLVLATAVGCPLLDQGGSGGPSSDGSGGDTSTGGRPSSDVPACAALFDGACELPSYDYYLQLCENENSGAVADILDCVVPDCLTPADQGTEFCIQLAVEDEQNAAVASLMYDLESLCGSQLDNAKVRVVGVHAASINDVDHLDALIQCLSGVYCDQIVDCLTDPDVAPWWDE